MFWSKYRIIDKKFNKKKERDNRYFYTPNLTPDSRDDTRRIIFAAFEKLMSLVDCIDTKIQHIRTCRLYMKTTQLQLMSFKLEKKIHEKCNKKKNHIVQSIEEVRMDLYLEFLYWGEINLTTLMNKKMV